MCLIRAGRKVIHGSESGTRWLYVYLGHLHAGINVIVFSCVKEQNVCIISTHGVLLSLHFHRV